MKSRAFIAGRILLLALSVCVMAVMLPPQSATGQPAASAQAATTAPQAMVIKVLAEKKVTQLPAGPWYWSIENFPTLAAAQAAESPTSLSVQVADKAWLFTLGAKGQPTHGGTKVAEVGPITTFTAPEFLLRVNGANGPPEAKSPVHSHPGSEAFCVLTGQLSLKTADGVSRVDAGQFMTGRAPDTPMQIANSGSSDVSALVLFVVDATRPFSSPAKFE